MKMIDMTTNPPTEVEALNISDISIKVAKAKNRVDAYYFRGTLEGLHMADTPKPDYMVNGVPYWKPDRVQEWINAYDASVQQEAEVRAVTLSKEKLSKQEIVDCLVKKARQVARRNALAYPNQRGNSIADAKQRYHELVGVHDFVKSYLLDNTLMVPADRDELGKLMSQAKKDAKLD